MTIDTKILNKILENQVLHIHMTTCLDILLMCHDINNLKEKCQTITLIDEEKVQKNKHKFLKRENLLAP